MADVTVEGGAANRPAAATSFLVAAWIVALVATLGALFVGEVMGQTPCHLCWYQRIAMFPLGLVLGVAAWRGDVGAWRYALPLAVAGLGVAGFHGLVYAGLVPEGIEPCSRTGPSCSDAAMTILGGLPLPYLSLAAFAAITLLIALARQGHRA